MEAARPRVLVVDDDSSLRMLMRINLELEGFEVAEAATAAEAEASVRAHRPDAVLLDVHLRGHETHNLRARLRADGIPVAVVTGSADVDDLRTDTEVLTKPFTPQALVDLARRLARVTA
jgi:CheY-like chemotaxis protein